MLVHLAVIHLQNVETLQLADCCHSCNGDVVLVFRSLWKYYEINWFECFCIFTIVFHVACFEIGIAV